MADLSQENSKGTLNFIRLSPRDSSMIFVGKLLGVPILTYLSVALLVPLHIISGIAGGIPLWFFFSYYVLLLAFALLDFSLAIVSTLIGFGEQKFGGIQALGGAIFLSVSTLFLFTPLFINWNSFTAWNELGFYLFGRQNDNIASDAVQWWYLPLGNNTYLAHLHSLTSIGLMTIVLWLILKRRFNNPQATILSKGLSYFTTAFIEIFILGFLLRTDTPDVPSIPLVGLMYVINFLIFLGLVILLSPTRGEVKEWASYLRSGDWFYELIWFDKTPSIVAIAVNLIISQSLLISWVLITFPNDFKLLGISVFLLLSFQSLFYALIYQNVLLTRVRKPLTWALGTIITLVFLPVIFLTVLRLSPTVVSYLWLVLCPPWSLFAFSNDNIAEFFYALVTIFWGIFLAGIWLVNKVKNLAKAE